MSDPIPDSLPVSDCFAFVEQKLIGDQIASGILTEKPGERVRVYKDEAPEGTTYPFIRFSLISAPHRGGNGARRAFTNVLLRIEAIDNTASSKRIKPLLGRINALFAERATGDAGGSHISGSICEEDVAPPTEVRDNVSYSRLGGNYRFFVHKKV